MPSWHVKCKKAVPWHHVVNRAAGTLNGAASGATWWVLRLTLCGKLRSSRRTCSDLLAGQSPSSLRAHRAQTRPAPRHWVSYGHGAACTAGAAAPCQWEKLHVSAVATAPCSLLVQYFRRTAACTCCSLEWTVRAANLTPARQPQRAPNFWALLWDCQWITPGNSPSATAMALQSQRQQQHSGLAALGILAAFQHQGELLQQSFSQARVLTSCCLHRVNLPAVAAMAQNSTSSCSATRRLSWMQQGSLLQATPCLRSNQLRQRKRSWQSLLCKWQTPACHQWQMPGLHSKSPVHCSAFRRSAARNGLAA